MKVAPTYLLVGANVAVYIVTSVVGGNLATTDLQVLLIIGQVNRFVVRGWYWQLFTAMFVHINIVHIASNMLFLFIFGIRSEEFFRPMETYLVYFASGLAGNLLTLVAGPYIFFVSAGASGAIFGLFGANMVYLRKILQRPITEALAYGFILLILNISANVNLIAHFGGLVTGVSIGYFIAARSTVIRRQNRILVAR